MYPKVSDFCEGGEHTGHAVECQFCFYEGADGPFVCVYSITTRGATSYES